MTLQELIDYISEYIHANGNQEITGDIQRDVLVLMAEVLYGSGGGGGDLEQRVSDLEQAVQLINQKDLDQDAEIVALAQAYSSILDTLSDTTNRLNLLSVDMNFDEDTAKPYETYIENLNN